MASPALQIPSTLQRAAVLAKIKRHPKGVNLNIGCGSALQREDEWLGIDMLPIAGAIHHDLEVYPWPIPDECARLATAGCVLPHINPARLGVIRFMNEAWRVLKPDADFMLTTQYGQSQAWLADPTHVAHFTEQSFLYFDPMHASRLYDIYRPKPWKLRHVNFQTDGIMEVVLSKRRIDKSYGTRDIV